MEFYDDNEEIANSSLFSVSSGDEEAESYGNEISNNTSLKYGIVIDLYEVDDKKNLNKKTPEYNVLVVDKKINESVEPKVYKNCISVDGFGGVAEFFEFKKRPVKTKEDQPEGVLNIDFEKQFGNMVLLLCLNGSTDRGIIIKSLPHAGRKTTLTKENGLHMEGEYNGLNWKVDKDGALTVTFKSATDDKGKPQDETAGGSFISIDKAGSVDINPGEGTNIKLDKPAKDISVNAGNNITAKAVKDVTIDAGGKGTVKSVADMLIDCGGSAKFTAKSKINIEATGELEIKGSKIKLESKAKLDIKGKAILLDAPEIDIGKGGTPALITNTMFLGTGNLGAPVLCKAQGPFSSVVYIK